MGNAIEEAIREAHARGDMDGAVRIGLSQYRDEVYSFLYARLASASDAHDVFGQMTEDLWRGIERFEWRCSFRTWLYMLARHAAVRFERTPANRAGRRVSLSNVPDAAAHGRSRTRPYLRTDIKDRFAALRASLTPEEQSLLVLRVDRGMSWEDASRILHDNEDVDDESLRLHAAALRQRFQKLKRRLREIARSEGLLDDEQG